MTTEDEHDDDLEAEVDVDAEIETANYGTDDEDAQEGDENDLSDRPSEADFSADDSPNPDEPTDEI